MHLGLFRWSINYVAMSIHTLFKKKLGWVKYETRWDSTHLKDIFVLNTKQFCKPHPSLRLSVKKHLLIGQIKRKYNKNKKDLFYDN